MPIGITALKHAGEVLHELVREINRVSPDPTEEALVAIAHVVAAREILTQMTRYLQIDANAEAVKLLLADLAHDRLRLALPDSRDNIRGEISTGLVAARMLTQAHSVRDLAQCQAIIVFALESAQSKLNGSPDVRLN